MPRVDLYGAVHKGLRSLLFETAGLVARTEFERPAEAAAAAVAVERLLAFLEEHAEHEDRALQPVLEELAPDLALALREDHARTHGRHVDIARLLARLATATRPERASLGRRLLAAVNALVAVHLVHLDVEEGQANRILWAHRSDAQLLEIQDRILGSIAPERLALWLERILPAAAAGERAGMLATLRRASDEASFAALTAPARRLLGEPAWQDALAG